MAGESSAGNLPRLPNTGGGYQRAAALPVGTHAQAPGQQPLGGSQPWALLVGLLTALAGAGLGLVVVKARGASR